MTLVLFFKIEIVCYKSIRKSFKRIKKLTTADFLDVKSLIASSSDLETVPYDAYKDYIYNF